MLHDLGTSPLSGPAVAAGTLGFIAVLYFVIWRHDRERGMLAMCGGLAVLAAFYGLEDRFVPSGNQAHPVAMLLVLVGGALWSVGLCDFSRPPSNQAAWWKGAVLLPLLLNALLVVAGMPMPRPWHVLPLMCSFTVTVCALMLAARREPRAGFGYVSIAFIAVPASTLSLALAGVDTFHLRYYAMPSAILFALTVLAVNVLRRRVQLEVEVDRRKAAEQALARRADRLVGQVASKTDQLDTLLSLCGSAIADFDVNGRIRYANSGLEALIGMSDEGVLGLTLGELERRLVLRSSKDSPGLGVLTSMAAAQDDIEQPPTRLTLEVPAWLALDVVHRRSADGGTVFFLRDVTAASQVERMKSEFMTTAAHELRTPLASVYGFTELLLKRSVPQHKQREMLETVHSHSSRLIELVNEMVDLTQIDSRRKAAGKREACRLRDVVLPMMAEVRKRSPNHEFLTSLAHGDQVVYVDSTLMQRALGNVLANAVQYSKEGSRIQVTTTMGRRKGEAMIGLIVTDQGIGMSPEQVTRTFERFYRGDASGHVSGNGLGMSIVKEICEQQGGRVQVGSAPGKGTVVTLWIPSPMA
jgi:signal transduction histidine kinase